MPRDHVWHPYMKKPRREGVNPLRMAKANRPKSYVCPVCHMESFHPEDVRYSYCAHCHRYTGKR
jgi:hypothetical protein